MVDENNITTVICEVEKRSDGGSTEQYGATEGGVVKKMRRRRERLQ